LKIGGVGVEGMMKLGTIGARVTEGQDSTYSFTGATTGFGGATAYYHPLWLFLVPNCFFVFLPDGQISFRPV